MIKKAVLPVAGFGTRFLPASKATPKEMLPIIDKPLVQYAVEEAIDSGINEIIFITSPEKHSIKKHFKTNKDLELRLQNSGKEEVIEKLNPKKFSKAKFYYINQYLKNKWHCQAHIEAHISAASCKVVRAYFKLPLTHDKI